MTAVQKTRTLIEVTGLGRRFGKEWAVRDLNLKLDAGQILGLMGPNGAGKTTTLKMLATLEFPTCGDVRIDGASALEDRKTTETCSFPGKHPRRQSCVLVESERRANHCL